MFEIPCWNGEAVRVAFALRFYALRLHEVGMIQSTPSRIIADGTNWQFLEELKREMKA